MDWSSGCSDADIKAVCCGEDRAGDMMYKELLFVPSIISMVSGGSQWPAWLTAHTGWRYPHIL